MHEIGQAQYCVNVDSVVASTLIERFRALNDARERESTRLEQTVLWSDADH
jgi:hypothetical protein